MTNDNQSATDRSPSLVQPVDDAVRTQARGLIRAARYGALAVLRPSDGHPAASRVLLATDFSGRPILLISQLSLHAKALAKDGRCSLLIGEPGKGDPLAHPRLTLFAFAAALDNADPALPSIRDRFLARQPKAALYAGFADFHFVRLEPSGGALNGGFAKAYELEAADCVDPSDQALETTANRAMRHMNADHSDAIDQIAATAGAAGTNWRIATIDRYGFEIVRGDKMERIVFRRDPAAEGGYRAAFVDLVARPDSSISVSGPSPNPD